MIGKIIASSFVFLFLSNSFIMKLKFVFFTFIMASFGLNGWGQSNSVTIHKDARLSQRITDLGVIIPPNPTPQIDGYRVQITFEQSKKNIDMAKETFAKFYPDIDTYIIYKAPNFFLRAGDFRTFNEAEKVKNKIEVEFPTSNVVREKINLPKID